MRCSLMRFQVNRIRSCCLSVTGLPFSGADGTRGREESKYKGHECPHQQDRESPLKITDPGAKKKKLEIHQYKEMCPFYIQKFPTYQ